ncbi:hypothetical protein IAU59_000618 [Kwoniella sp. CBS 9459]
MQFTANILTLATVLFSLSTSVLATPQDLTAQLALANAAEWPVTGQEGCPLEAAKAIYSSHSARLGGFSTTVVMGYPTQGAQMPADACESAAEPQVTSPPVEARALPRWK